MTTYPNFLGPDEVELLDKILSRRLGVAARVRDGTPFQNHCGTWLRLVHVFMHSGLRAWSTPDEYFAGDIDRVVERLDAWLRPQIERIEAEDLAEAIG